MPWFAGPLLALTLMSGDRAPGLLWIDVGQGSALLVLEPQGHAMLVDSGPPSGAEAVLDALDRHGVDHIALWVHTHWDADHVGGYARVVAGIDGAWPSDDDPSVEQLWDRGLSQAPSTDAVLLYGVLAGERRRDVSDGAQLQLGDASVRSIPLDRSTASEENARGLALCIELPGLRLLAPGDLPAAAVEEAARECGPVDVLWASHHGSADGISPALVDLADPGLVVVGAGRDNPFCHPSPVALALLHEHEVWITQAAGLAPDGPCEAIGAVLGPRHRLAGGELWLALDGR